MLFSFSSLCEILSATIQMVIFQFNSNTLQVPNHEISLKGMTISPRHFYEIRCDWWMWKPVNTHSGNK